MFAFILFGAALLYVYQSDMIDKITPKITLYYDFGSKSNIIYWNKKNLIKVNLFDNDAIESFEISFLDKNNKIVLFKQTLLDKKLNINRKIFFPENGVIDSDVEELDLLINVRDRSSWNFLLGNSINQKTKIEIDTYAPEIKILSNSYNIVQGGAGLVIFKASDKNLKNVYIESNNKKLKVQKYKKDGYYIALIPWIFNSDNIEFNIIAIDYADNKTSFNIPFHKKYKKYKTSWIKLKDDFLDGEISNLLDRYTDYKDVTNKLLKFKIVNETLRQKNEILISSFKFRPINKNIKTWNISKFHPLPRSKKVASFGDTRYFYKDKKKSISKSYHLGLDLASIKHDNIFSNYGKIIFTGYNGIYGNMVLVEHGLGLKSVYGHCSSILAKQNNIISNKTIIAKTGKTGLALGDHLHFGIILHETSVRPEEWIDQHWIDDNINKVLKKADLLIE